MAELLLRDGDYVPDGQGGLRRAEGTDGLLQRVLFQLSARRGSFPFLPELGSRLYALAEVANYRFTAPAADIPAGGTVLPVLGTLAVTEMEA